LKALAEKGKTVVPIGKSAAEVKFPTCFDAAANEATSIHIK